MEYDPIKRTLGNLFNRSSFLRIIFYRLLDLLLLRSWHIHRELKRWAKGKKGSDQMILDAGAGFGQYTYYLSSMSRKWNITAVDVKEEQVEDCNRFFKKIGRGDQVNFMVGDLTKYQVPSGFDLIVCVDVMEHILEDEAVFRNFCASLQPAGELFISTPSDQGGSDVKEGEGTSFISEHVRDGYNMEDIRRKLLNAGFSVVEPTYSYGTPGQISWRLSMKYPMTLLNISKLFFILLPFYYLITFPFCLILNYWDTHSKHSTGTGLIVRAIK